MASKHSGSQWFASIFLTAALASSPLTLAGPTSAQGQFEAPVRTDAPQGYGDWSALRVTLELRSANDYARASKVVSRWLGELPKADARYPLRLRVLVTGMEQERLTRMSIRPALADELNALLEGHAKDAGDTFKALKPTVSQLNLGAAEGISQRLSAADGEARLRGVLVGLSVPEANGLNALTSLDDDGDGLTNTQEAWWCTNPLNADSDGDGASDAIEVQQAKEWVGNLRATFPAKGKPFPNWPMQDNGGNNPDCPDSDRDGVPDLAEQWELGLNPNKESTDGDKFDDGQELFGLTTPGWGGLPNPADPAFIGYEVPTWLSFPGNHPLVSALPDIQIEIAPNSYRMRAVTTVTTDRTISSGEEHSYSAAQTKEVRTSIADMQSWNDWQEVSESTTQRISGLARPNDVGEVVNAIKTKITKYRAYNRALDTVRGGCDTSSVTLGVDLGVTIQGTSGMDSVLTNQLCRTALSKARSMSPEFALDFPDEENTHTVPQTPVSGSPTIRFDPHISTSFSSQVIVQNSFDTENIARGLAGVQFAQLQSGQVIGQRLHEIAWVLSQPEQTSTNTRGKSWGGSQTLTTEEAESNTLTNGQAFSSASSWATAIATNSAYAADFWFTYTVRNVGLDYARQIGGLSFNVYVDDELVCTYFVGSNECGTPSAGQIQFSNLAPGGQLIVSAHRIAIDLDTMRAIDLGAKIQVSLASLNYGSGDGSDEYYMANSIQSGVVLRLDDGTDDGDDGIDSFVIPTWGDADTVQDVIGRYFPHSLDSSGQLSSIWTPESRSDTPAWCAEPRRYSSISAQVWCKHALSTADWWNIYLNNLGDGTGNVADTLAAPNSIVLFRFNKDADIDGYSDRTELRMGTDPLNAASHPNPELIAGSNWKPAVTSIVSGTVSLLNTGLYDAYGVELVLLAPDDSISILNNTVGGGGRVRAGRNVVVGSSIKLPGTMSGNWGATGHAKPSVGGYYTGNSDSMYTITAACSNPGGCDVGAGTWTIGWSDGAGITGTRNFGAGYASPTPVTLTNGVELSLLSGKVYNNETFTLTARPPLDTFSYQINRQPYTPPVVMLSYNDPQGNHRSIVPVTLASPTQDLAPFAGQMIPTPGVEMVTSRAFTAGLNGFDVVVDNPTGKIFWNAHVFVEMINVSGTVVSEVPLTVTLQPGPNVVPVAIDTAVFSPTFDASQDYIVMVFFTDYQGNIAATAGRPASSFQPDPKPSFAMNAVDQDWDFGSAAQGTLLKRSFTFANVGLQDMLTYIQGVPGLSLSQTGSRKVSAADQTTYEIALNTIGLPMGVYDQSIVIRTSDQTHPTQTVRVHGVVTIGPADGLPIGLLRPLDTIVTVTNGVPGTLVTFDHGLNQPSLDRLHPIKVFANPVGALIGVGKYATEFGVGVADANMFGNGGDLAAPSSGNFDSPNGIGIGSINSGALGSYAINVSNQQNSARIRAGNMVMLHQSRGANAGCWEVNQSATDFSGGTSIQAMVLPLKCNYSSAGNDRAQVIRIPQYGACSNMSGAYVLPASWNGTFGGILPVMCNSSFVLNGSISANGGNGSTGNDGNIPGGSGSGFRGGDGDAVNNDSVGIGIQGEGTSGPGGHGSGANGNGGGAGAGNPYGTGGGGGNGSDGGASTAGGLGAGGLMAGNPALTNMVFGGGGGGSNDNPGNSIGGGGAGGGIVVIFAPDITINGSIVLNGGNGGGSKWGAGGGAGGSALLRGRNVNFGSSRISAIGGNPGNRGGAGASGRVRVEYCSTRAGSSNPTAIEAQIGCFSVEQVEVAPFTQGRLNPPSYGTAAYNIQYGWRNVYASPGNSAGTIRIPAGLISSVQFDVLGSQMVGAGSVAVDVAGSPGVECSGAIANAGSLVCNSNGLRDAFVAYWRSQNSPTSGTLDVPITVTLDRAGQILLTNLQVQTTGSKVRYLQLPAQAYSAINLRYNVGQAANLAIDVGDDGSIDQNVNVPAGENGLDLTTAITAYLSTRNGVVNVPLRIYLSPFTTFDLVSLSAAPTLRPDASITLADVSFSDAEPTESETISMTAVLRNSTAHDTGGLVASAFAILSGTTPGAYFIGSAFVPNVPASGTATTEIAWNTLGITGTVPVRVVLDPYNRISETLESNNVATATLTLRSRADLLLRSTSLPAADLTVGKTATFAVVIGNDGQTAAPANTLGLFRGNADAGIPPEEMLGLAGVPGSGAVTATVTYTPTEPGPLRLSLRANLSRTVNEFDLSNNDLWLDRYVGVGGERVLDSGNPPNDPTYTTTLGYGAVDEGQPDATAQQCPGSAGAPEDTFRRDPGGRIVARFDHLKREAFYHLDIVLNGCNAGAGRQETIKINGVAMAGPIDIGGANKQRISRLLDPALYGEREISVTIETTSSLGAVASVIALREVEYSYIDAGGGADPAYTPQTGHGWLDTPTAVNANCGPLPYQTLRVDQNDNELRYRFDRLNPTKKYILRSTFYQCEGINLQQGIQIDVRVTGADVFIPPSTVVVDEREVPLTTYANDGSIDVSILRQTDATGALLSEIAIEEKTLEEPQACPTLRRTTADNFSMVYGGVYVGGLEVPAGTLVTAEDPRGNVVGCFAVSAAGIYGTMALLGEDTSVVPALPGMRAGEPPLFRIGGALAVPQPVYSFTADADIHPVTLTTDGIGAQQVLMVPGWNFVSTRNQHPVGLVETVLRPISGKYCRVRGETQLYACTLPENFRTLKQLNAGVGYYIYITNTATVNGLFEGVTQPPDKPIPLHAGLNWAGYLPPVPLPVTYGLQSLAGHYVRVVDINADQVTAYMPALPQFSFLTTLRPGSAYLIYTTDAVTLTYPAAPPAMAQTESKEAEAWKAQTQASCGTVPKTPDFTLLYGYARVNGRWAAPGAKVEAVTPQGVVAGCAVVREDGMFGLFAAFGADPVTGTPGALNGQALRFRIDGLLDETTTLTWENDHDAHVVYPSVAVNRAFLPNVSR